MSEDVRTALAELNKALFQVRTGSLSTSADFVQRGDYFTFSIGTVATNRPAVPPERP